MSRISSCMFSCHMSTYFCCLETSTMMTGNLTTFSIPDPGAFLGLLHEPVILTGQAGLLAQEAPSHREHNEVLSTFTDHPDFDNVPTTVLSEPCCSTFGSTSSSCQHNSQLEPSFENRPLPFNSKPALWHPRPHSSSGPSSQPLPLDSSNCPSTAGRRPQRVSTSISQFPGRLPVTRPNQPRKPRTDRTCTSSMPARYFQPHSP